MQPKPAILLFIGLLVGLASGAHADEDSLSAQVEGGEVRGLRTDVGARAWYDVPYAAPPTGERRWRPPAAVVAWQGVRPAMAPGPPCVQAQTRATGDVAIVGSEDCLTLNVFSPVGPVTRPLPVMLWIHGGGQFYGSGAAFDGSRLATTQNVIVVTINYRLGPFGWFHHPAITGRGAARTTGQFGLLDAIAALRWVQRNIAVFDGDAGNVTVFGESAGAQIVYGLVLAPHARGLFHKAIAQSGGFWNMSLAQAVHFHDDKVPGTPLGASEVVNAMLVASGRANEGRAARALQRKEAPQALAAWLRARTPTEVLAPYLRASHAEYDLPSLVYDGVLIPFGDHRSLLARGAYNAVPMIVGGNRDEQKLFQSSDPGFVRTVEGRVEILDARRYAEFNRLYSDWWNFSAVDDLLPRLRSRVYAYRFDWDDESTSPSDLKTVFGSAHGLELAFVFGIFRWDFIHDDLPAPADAPRDSNPFRAIFNDRNGASRSRLSDAMMSYWANFARTSAPGRGTHQELPAWDDWATGQRKLIFENRGLRLEAGLIDEPSLLSRLWASSTLTAAEKCAVFLDNAMYPRYPLRTLARHRCRRD